MQIHHHQLKKTQIDALPVLVNNIPVINEVHYSVFYGRKQRRTKEPLDESERGELKSWLKTQHSEN